MLFRRRPAVRSEASIELERALEARVARAATGFGRRNATLLFDAGADGEFTLAFRGDQVSLRRGRPRRPSATLKADARTLIDVLSGETPGIEAFLDGRLAVRDNIALPLELDDRLPPLRRDVRSPSCRSIDAYGVKTFFLEAGPKDAPAVVLLHGLGATSASFLPTLWDLARDHRVLAPDLPGFGESSKPIRPLHAPFFAKWLARFLDVVGVHRARAIGNSMGGRVALELALRFPERVDRIALLAPSLAWRRYRIGVRLVRLLRPELAILPLPILRRVVVGVLRFLFAKPERVPKGAMHGAADEFLRAFGTSRGRIAFFHAAREIYLEDPLGHRGFWDRLPSLNRPALFVFGHKDRLVPRAFVRHVERAVPAARCVVLEDCGHVPQFEMPDTTHGLIRSFFGEPAI